MGWLAIGLIVLNVVQAIALFFKGPINELIKEYVLDRYRESKRRRELLKTLHGHREYLPGVYMNWLAFASLAEHDPSPEGGTQAEKLRDENFQRMGAIKEFIRQNRLDFPLSVQNQLGRLEDAMKLSPDELVILDLRVIDRAMERIKGPLLELEAAVRAELKA